MLSSRTGRFRTLVATPLALAAFAIALPASASAALRLVGSPLSVPATLNTSANLHYVGLYTPVPPNPEAPNGVFHTPHYGADTALWNTKVAGGTAAMPSGGEAVKVRLEGCAQPAANGPAPLNQIHFQDITPMPDGSAKVNISSQSFELPVCGQGGAGASTVTTYEPFDLCVSQGDYVDFNDEGGYVPNIYRAGVPYQVLGSVAGSSMDSFIRGGGTGNGALLSAGDTTAMDGFAVNAEEELLMQVELGTGKDARYVCPGGTKDAPAALAPMKVSPQTDGINSSRIVSVALYCRPTSGCPGSATLTLPSGAVVGRASFSLPGGHTSHVPIQVTGSLLRQIRAHHGVTVRLAATFAGQTFSASIRIKIF
jgi:hypothetical protein